MSPRQESTNAMDKQKHWRKICCEFNQNQINKTGIKNDLTIQVNFQPFHYVIQSIIIFYKMPLIFQCIVFFSRKEYFLLK
jgi:hypothetical protein